MGLFADINGAFTSTKVAMNNVYLRINQVNVYPKYGVIKIAVSGYLNKESGQLLRNPEYEMARYVDTVYQTTGMSITNDAQITMGYMVNRDEMIPPQAPDEPFPIFRDIYTIKMTEANASAMTVESLYPILYNALKADPRLNNVRDDI
ncbi:hypothetical protein SDC9_05174 [bioreactor metagenome]|uniref:Uncharacterized protein n=1 Tax=bioreactor metagenome TaxID=1076179 RepID=A0A644SY48_9ZZZZ